MTDKEAIDAVRSGKRAVTETSLHAAELPGSVRCRHRWRAVACDFETDVIECSDCGTQRTCSCDFDDDCA